jgi:capsid protein
VSKGYRIIDHRGRPSAYSLYEGSWPGTAPRRSQILSSHATDTKNQVTAGDWKQMLSVGRYLYANVGAVAGAINEMGTYAVGDAWLPQYQGRNKEWGDMAEEWLAGWFSICDVRGNPYDFQTDLFLTSVSIDRDGDNLMLLTQSESGYPMLQFIPAHRIGQRTHTGSKVETGDYAGLEMCNGVVFNGFQRPVAYHILGDATDGSADQFVSARDAQLHFSPTWYDQGRGITSLSNAIIDWRDYRDIRDFEKLGIKTASETAVIEKNEQGSADAGQSHFDTDATTGLVSERLEGGAIRYFRANAGCGLEVLKSERPSNETQGFIQDQIMRGAFAGLQWPIEFSWNPEKLGGANIRMIVEKAERAVKRRQKYIGLTWRRAVYYGVAKAMKIGVLPFDADWFLWDAQLPKSLTVDAGNQSKADIEEYRIGFKTLSEIYGRRGLDWQAQLRQRIAERKFLLEELQGSGIKPEEIQMLTPNGNKPQGDSGEDEED